MSRTVAIWNGDQFSRTAGWSILPFLAVLRKHLHSPKRMEAFLWASTAGIMPAFHNLQILEIRQFETAIRSETHK